LSTYLLSELWLWLEPLAATISWIRQMFGLCKKSYVEKFCSCQIFFQKLSRRSRQICG